MPLQVRVLVVIVNYRSAELTVQCLRSLADEPGCGDAWKVIVADCASGDGSVDRIGDALDQNGWRAWVTLLPLPRNGGFAYGNNSAIREVANTQVQSEYVLLLNPDTIVRPGAIDALLDFMQRNPRVGIAGSRLEAPDGSPQASAFRFHTIASEFLAGLRLGLADRLLRRWRVPLPPSDHPMRADWVSGAAMIIRRVVLEQFGMLDEGFFMYFEETDFCRRARRAGWQTWHVPASRVIHLEGQSCAPSSSARRLRPAWYESRKRYFFKHHGPLYARAADAAWLLGAMLRRARLWAQGRDHSESDNEMRGFLAYSTLPPRGKLLRDSHIGTLKSICPSA